jgi:hypothetical protein
MPIRESCIDLTNLVRTVLTPVEQRSSGNQVRARIVKYVEQRAEPAYPTRAEVGLRASLLNGDALGVVFDRLSDKTADRAVAQQTAREMMMPAEAEDLNKPDMAALMREMAARSSRPA